MPGKGPVTGVITSAMMASDRGSLAERVRVKGLMKMDSWFAKANGIL